MAGDDKALLLRGVNINNDEIEFPGCEWELKRHTEIVFMIAKKAIKMFQAEPTALILFPNVWLPKIQTMYDYSITAGGYDIRSPYNNATLRLYFRDINPNFNITVCTVAEREKPFYSGNPEFNQERKIGVLFTYAKLF